MILRRYHANYGELTSLINSVPIWAASLHGIRTSGRGTVPVTDPGSTMKEICSKVRHRMVSALNAKRGPLWGELAESRETKEGER